MNIYSDFYSSDEALNYFFREDSETSDLSLLDGSSTPAVALQEEPTSSSQTSFQNVSLRADLVEEVTEETSDAANTEQEQKKLQRREKNKFSARRSRQGKKDAIQDLHAKEQTCLGTIRELDIQASELVGHCRAFLQLLDCSSSLQKIASQVDEIYQHILQNPYQRPLEALDSKKAGPRTRKKGSNEDRAERDRQSAKRHREKIKETISALESRIPAMESHIDDMKQKIASMEAWKQEFRTCVRSGSICKAGLQEA